MLFVVVFQQPGAGQLAIGQPQQPARPARGTIQESATDDSIADIHAHDRKELRRRGVKIVRRAVIKVPIEHEVSGENTAAGYRGDVCYLGQKASVPQKTDQPEMIQSRPETASGKGKTDPVHDRLSLPQHGAAWSG